MVLVLVTLSSVMLSFTPCALAGNIPPCLNRTSTDVAGVVCVANLGPPSTEAVLEAEATSSLLRAEQVTGRLQAVMHQVDALASSIATVSSSWDAAVLAYTRSHSVCQVRRKANIIQAGAPQSRSGSSCGVKLQVVYSGRPRILTLDWPPVRQCLYPYPCSAPGELQREDSGSAEVCELVQERRDGRRLQSQSQSQSARAAISGEGSWY